jgi:hypothetical protein
VLALAACAGSSAQGGDTVGPPQAPTLVPGGASDRIATMVMPLRFFGDRYEHFEADSDSGYLDTAEMAQETILATDAAADIEARGFLSGYELAFEDARIMSFGLVGIYSVGTEVDLFADSTSASAFMARELADVQALVGQDIGGGVVLTEFTTFEVTELGDEAIGAHASFSANGAPLHSTVVWLRLGNYLASAEIAGNYKGGVSEEEATTEWGHILQARILGVESGAIEEEPVPIPTLAPTLAPVMTAAP